MLARDFKLSWANYEKVNAADIEHDLGRDFIRELTNRPRHIIIDAYVCSDARNQYIRQILTQIPYVVPERKPLCRTHQRSMAMQ